MRTTRSRAASLRQALRWTLRSSAAFLRAFAGFVEKIAAAGMANALTQSALRCLLPGVPDLYQGAELWDFSLVDPDNRRPVDFPLREKLLAQETRDRRSGGLKQSMIRRLLDLRREEPELFAYGDYRPIEVEGVEGADVVRLRAPPRRQVVGGRDDVAHRRAAVRRRPADAGGEGLGRRELPSISTGYKRCLWRRRRRRGTRARVSRTRRRGLGGAEPQPPSAGSTAGWDIGGVGPDAARAAVELAEVMPESTSGGRDGRGLVAVLHRQRRGGPVPPVSRRRMRR